MKEHPRVDILMATYNGQTYLKEQVLSLQAQTHDNWRLLVSDDGSTDDTMALLHTLANEDERVCVLDDGELHRGPCGRFLWLLEQSTADYVLFCDQDDYWEARKVETLLDACRNAEAEKGTDNPILVFCDAAVVNDRLEPLADSFMAFEHYDPRRTQLRKLLVCNVAPGCAMLLNRALIDLLRLPDDHSSIIMHDWWLMLTAAARGTIVYVDEPLIKYRQHGSNVEGAKTFDVLGYLRKLDNVARSHLRCQRQAAAFAEAYSRCLKPEDYVMCAAFGNMKKGGVQPVLTLARYGLWQPSLPRKIGQVTVRLLNRPARES